MPTYQYRCTECGEDLEVVQKFSDDPLKVCPSCQGSLRKIFSPVGIVFKGSGFYRTDSRKGSSGSGSGDGAGKKDKEPTGAKSESGDSGKSSANGSSSGSTDSSSSSGSSGSSGKSAEKSSSAATPAASKAG